MMNPAQRERLLETYRAHAGRFDMIAAEHDRRFGSHESTTRVSATALHSSGKSVSVREIDVLSLLSSGFSNAAIARRLTITEDTVKTHVKSLFAKLGARNRAHASAIGVQRGIVSIALPS